MKSIAWIEAQSRFSIENIKATVLAYYELLFPTVPKSAAEITREQTPKIVSRLLRANGESWDFVTTQQRAEKRIAVLSTEPKTLVSFGWLTLTSQDFGKPDRTRTDYTLSRAFFGKQVTVVLGAVKMPWTQE